MQVPSYLLAFEGSLVFLSPVLAYFSNINFLFISIFVGLNLFQYSITKFCPLVYFVNKFKRSK